MGELLKVVIVEPHHHALEHIHDALRRQRRLGQSWSLCHIDAHPDLACPSNGIPAAACFRPRDEWSVVTPADGTTRTGCLYELFDMSTTGISEWILPLVIAADLKFIEWVKPSTKKVTSQIPLGWKKFHVGAHEEEGVSTSDENDSPPKKTSISSFVDLSSNAFVKVDWDCLYYRDDDDMDFFAPLHLLQLPKPVELYVGEWSTPTPSQPTTCTESFPNNPWILDICLDYFYCVNPFFADIECVDKELARVTYEIVSLSSSYSTDTVGSTAFERDKLLQYRQLLRQVLPQIADSREISAFIQDFKPFIGDKQQEVQDALVKWKSVLASHKPSQRVKLLGLIMESLPYIMLPHSQLESNTSIQEHISTSLANFEHGLRMRLKSVTQPPFLVTIARSMYDGFTPESCADELQNQVKKILHKCLCGDECKDSESKESCRLQFSYDYESTVHRATDSISTCTG